MSVSASSEDGKRTLSRLGRDVCEYGRPRLTRQRATMRTEYCATHLRYSIALITIFCTVRLKIRRPPSSCVTTRSMTSSTRARATGQAEKSSLQVAKSNPPIVRGCDLLVEDATRASFGSTGQDGKYPRLSKAKDPASWVGERDKDRTTFSRCT